MNKLSRFGKISIALAVLFLSTLWIWPMWQIDLAAPQYPGGLKLLIWINDVGGDVDVINGLNHYIGMKTIKKEDIREFIYLPATMISFMALGIIILLLNRKKWLYVYTGILLLISLVSFADFYLWLYDYGHNLDPNAPIQVPGMSYQPPLVGYKKMLNFEALSQPHVGGWFFIAAGILLVVSSWMEIRKSKHEIVEV